MLINHSIYLMYHSFAQVSVGGLVGFITACIYYIIVKLMRPVIEWVVHGPIGHLLLLRDTRNLPHVQEFDRKSWLQTIDRKIK